MMLLQVDMISPRPGVTVCDAGRSISGNTSMRRRQQTPQSGLHAIRPFSLHHQAHRHHLQPIISQEDSSIPNSSSAAREHALTDALVT